MYQFGQRARVISLWQTLMEACQALILQLNSVIWCQCHLLAFVQRCLLKKHVSATELSPPTLKLVQCLFVSVCLSVRLGV